MDKIKNIYKYGTYVRWSETPMGCSCCSVSAGCVNRQHFAHMFSIDLFYFFFSLTLSSLGGSSCFLVKLIYADLNAPAFKIVLYSSWGLSITYTDRFAQTDCVSKLFNARGSCSGTVFWGVRLWHFHIIACSLFFMQSFSHYKYHWYWNSFTILVV